MTPADIGIAAAIIDAAKAMAEAETEAVAKLKEEAKEK